MIDDRSDPATWPTWCPLNCHVDFDAKATATGPYARHRLHGVEVCPMARSLYAAYNRRQARRKTQRRHRSRMGDVEPWAQTPWV